MSSVKNRVLRGIAAGTLGPLVTIVIQVFSVPIFLHYWGAKLYGEWLIISAIPTYLGLSDLGFGNVAGSEMTILVAADDRNAALRIFQSTWVLITCVSALVMVITTVCAWTLPLHQWFGLSGRDDREAAATLVVLAGYVIISLQGPLLLGGYRCEGNFPLGQLLTNVIRFAENLAMVVAVSGGSGILGAAVAYFLTRAAGTVAFYFMMRTKSPWLRVGFQNASAACVKRLLRPALAYMAFPAGYAMTLQGAVVLIGAVLGPVQVVVFSTLRTLTRSTYQAMEIIRASVWSEISAAFGAQNFELGRRIHRYTCQAALWMCCGGVAALCVAGPWLYRVWTHGKVVLDLSTFHWLLLVALVNSFWNASSVVPMATNKHERIAVAFLVATSCSILLAYPLMSYFGLRGVAIALLTADMVIAWYVVRTSLRVVQDRAGDFMHSMFTVREMVNAVRKRSRGVPQLSSAIPRL
jgi:O-antigen/teichoic acid export membrane protein